MAHLRRNRRRQVDVDDLVPRAARHDHQNQSMIVHLRRIRRRPVDADHLRSSCLRHEELVHQNDMQQRTPHRLGQLQRPHLHQNCQRPRGAAILSRSLAVPRSRGLRQSRRGRARALALVLKIVHPSRRPLRSSGLVALSWQPCCPRPSGAPLVSTTSSAHQRCKPSTAPDPRRHTNLLNPTTLAFPRSQQRTHAGQTDTTPTTSDPRAAPRNHAPSQRPSQKSATHSTSRTRTRLPTDLNTLLTAWAFRLSSPPHASPEPRLFPHACSNRALTTSCTESRHAPRTAVCKHFLCHLPSRLPKSNRRDPFVARAWSSMCGKHTTFGATLPATHLRRARRRTTPNRDVASLTRPFGKPLGLARLARSSRGFATSGGAEALSSTPQLLVERFCFRFERAPKRGAQPHNTRAA